MISPDDIPPPVAAHHPVSLISDEARTVFGTVGFFCLLLGSLVYDPSLVVLLVIGLGYTGGEWL